MSGNLHIGKQHLAVLPIGIDQASAIGLKGIDLLLVKRHDGGAQGFHYLAVARAKGLEVGFDFLHQKVVVGRKEFHLFHVEFGADEVLHSLNLSLHLGIAYRNDDARKRLTHTKVALFAQTEHHGANLLGQLHTFFEALVNHFLMHLGEGQMMHTCNVEAAGDSVEVEEHAFAEERRYGRHQAAKGLEASVKGLIGADLVNTHLATPETTTAEAYIPVAEEGIDKGIDGASGTGGLVVLEGIAHGLHQSVEFG